MQTQTALRQLRAVKFLQLFNNAGAPALTQVANLHSRAAEGAGDAFSSALLWAGAAGFAGALLASSECAKAEAPGSSSDQRLTSFAASVNQLTGASASRRQAVPKPAVLVQTTAQDPTVAESETPDTPETPQSSGSLPEYTREEVSRHKTPETGIWVTYKDGVYDITEFVALHPGGAGKILLAAGGAVDPFWALYQQHMKEDVQDIIAEYKIGTLLGGADVSQAGDVADPFAKDPPRHPALITRTAKPFNGETPGVLLHTVDIPTDLFYVRNHLPVPEVDAESYKVVVEASGGGVLELDLQQLQSRFKHHTISATLQCSGNRRNELKAIKPIKGLDWDVGAIGNATFTGVLLRDVLAAAGVDVSDAAQAAASSSSSDSSAPRHVHFIGLDSDPATGEVYGASIPLARALSPASDVLLAWDMNGAPLTRDHGAPLRVVVPGVAGARSVKWISKILLSPEESSSHWQQKDYKSFNPQVDWDTVDWTSAPAIQDTPVTSAICDPAPGAEVEGESITAKGYAFSGGGRGIVRVDVSVDGGATWSTARLQRAAGQEESVGTGRAWAWVQWETDLALPPADADGQSTIIVKAVDDAYNNQPDSVAPIWNLRGVVNNAWHRVTVKRAAAPAPVAETEPAAPEAEAVPEPAAAVDAVE